MSVTGPSDLDAHRLRTSILQAVADSREPLHGIDLVKKFAKPAQVIPPSVKDVRHAVRWLLGRGLVEWRKEPTGGGKVLHLTDAGDEAARDASYRGLRILGQTDPTACPDRSFPGTRDGGDAERSRSSGLNQDSGSLPC